MVRMLIRMLVRILVRLRLQTHSTSYTLKTIPFFFFFATVEPILGVWD